MAKQLQRDTAHGALIAKPPFIRIYTIQGIVLVSVSVALLFCSQVLAYSALLGGLISVVPNIYFASLAFRFSGARAASNVARSLYKGEIGKFVLTAILFASVFALVKPLSAAALFTVFILMMVLNGILVVFLSRF